jgi:hypothetical protein
MADPAENEMMRRILAQGPRVPLSDVYGPSGEQMYAPPGQPEPPSSELMQRYRQIQPYPINPAAMVEGALMSAGGPGAAPGAISGPVSHAASQVASSPLARALAGIGGAGVLAHDAAVLHGPMGSDAAPQKKGTPAAAPTPKLPGLTPDQQTTYDHAVKRLNAQDYGSGAERRMLEQTVQGLQGVSNDSVKAQNTAKATAEGESATGKVKEYNRAVETADAAFNKEMARDRRFSDTIVGKGYDAMGGLAPAAAGFLGAKLSRAATGPGQTTLGHIMKDYVAPLSSGTVSGAISANLPLAYNALGTEPDNPKKRAYEARAEALPSDHPRRQEFADYAATLPDANPVREAARREFYDPEMLKERLAIGGLEGFGGGLFGTDLFRALARLYKGSSGPGGPGGGTGGPAAPNMPPVEGGPLIPLPKGPAPAGPGLPPGGPAAGPSATGTVNKDLIEALKQNPPANVNAPKKATPDKQGKFHDDLGRYTPKPDND